MAWTTPMDVVDGMPPWVIPHDEGAGPVMSEDQKRAFVRDGHVSFPGVIPPEMLATARGVAEAALAHDLDADGDAPTGHHKSVSALYPGRVELRGAVYDGKPLAEHWSMKALLESTALRTLVLSAIGGDVSVRDNTPPTARPLPGVILVFPCGPPRDEVGCMGYPMSALPVVEPSGGPWAGHIDGVWSGGAKPPQDRDDAAAVEAWYDEGGTNGCPQHTENPDSNIINFTCIVGVVRTHDHRNRVPRPPLNTRWLQALSDAVEEGCGNLGVLSGAHTAVAEACAQQRAAGGPIGPDGPVRGRRPSSCSHAHTN